MKCFSLLLTGGVVAVAMPLGLATNADDLSGWERLASLGIGLGGIAATVWGLMRSRPRQFTSISPAAGCGSAGSGSPGVRSSELWSHDRAGIEESVVVLADTLGTAVMKAEAAH